MNRLSLILAAAVASACSASTAATKDADLRPLGTIRWSIDEINSPAPRDEVHLSIRSGSKGGGESHWSTNYSLAELQGLQRQALDAGSAPVQFALVREPGRFDCTGTGGNGRGIGTCRFTANASFAAHLSAAGIARPTERQSFNLTLGNVRSELIDELGRHGYDRPDIDDLVAMGIHGVTPAFVRDIAAAGYRLGKADGLVKFRIFGIDAEFIRAMAATGPQFRQLSADDLVQFKIFNVSPDLVRSYQSLGYDRLDSDDLQAMAIHGVSPEFITEMAALGYRGIDADRLVEMRIHGVTPSFVRGLQKEGIALPSADQLVRLRMSGYRPR